MAGGDHQIATPRSPTHSFAPQRIGRFEIIRRLGMGGFGAVFLAHDPQLDRQVALKIPRPGTLDDPEVRERFFREAKAAARLQHPHIVPVYDAGDDQGQSYIASAYVDGRTLADVLKERSVDPREAAQIVRKLAEALNYAHGQGIIHRDVKPANVMIDDKGEPHLMDFGLARLEQSAAQLTQDGTVMGTPAYMSPEQATGIADRITPASDQYSLGVVLYQLLTGRTPFDGPPQVVIYNVLNRPIPAPRSLKQEIPRDLETVCLKSVAKDAQGRYATCQAFADDLERWGNDESIRARRTGVVERFLRWCRREPRVAGLAAAVLVVFAVGFVLSSVQWVRAELETKRANEAVEREKRSASAAKESEERAIATSVELQAQRESLVQSIAEARRQRSEAERAAKAEQTAARDARAKEKLARAERLIGQKRLYLANLRLAQDVWNSGERSQAADLLASMGADEEFAVYRGWEWFYLSSLIHADIFRKQMAAEPYFYSATADWSPDGQRIAVPRADGGYAVLDPERGDVLFEREGKLTIKSPSYARPFLSWSRSLGLVAIGEKEEQTVTVWDDKSGNEVAQIELPRAKSKLASPGSEPLNQLVGLEWSPDGKSLAVGIGNASYNRHALIGVEIWAGSPIKRLRVIELDDAKSEGFTWTGDSTALLAHRSDTVVSINVASPSTRTTVFKGNHSGYYTAIACSPTNTAIALGDLRGEVRIVDLKAGRELASRQLHRGLIHSVAWSPSGNELASSGIDHRVVVWPQFSAGSEFSRPYLAATGDHPVNVLHWHSKSDLLLAASDNREITLLAGRRARHGASLPTPGPTRDGCWSPDGRHIATTGDLQVRAWEVESGKVTWPHRSATIVEGVRWLSTSDVLALVVRSPGGGSEAGLVKIGGSGPDSVIGEARMVRSASESDSLLLFSIKSTRRSGENDTVNVKRWHREAAAPEDLVSLDSRSFVTAEWSSDARRVAIASRSTDGIRIWDLVEKKELPPVTTSGVRSCCFSPNGDRLAVASSSGDFSACQIWEVDEGKFGPSLRSHFGEIASLHWHPTEPRLATAGRDGKVRIWNAITGDELLVLDAHDEYLSGIAWSPDGQGLAAWGPGLLRLWDASRGYQQAGIAPP